MKEIKFTPIRRIKKSGKATVVSYMEWRKVKTADYSEFNLTLKSDFSEFDPKERIYNHKGELLFWYNHKDPDSLRKLNVSDIIESSDSNGYDSSFFDGEHYKISGMEERLHWSVKGFDCDAVPVFSHYSLNYIAKMDMEVKDFEILTVETVLKWYGWFIYNLQNSILKQ